MMIPLFQFQKAIEAFDEKNAQDPNMETVDGKEVPHELIDAKRLSAWVLKLNPRASEALQLASRCQHICRWEVPRSNYPQGRAGYLKWRKDLKIFHADIAGETLSQLKYKQSVVERVRQLNLKEALTSDPEVQTLEDALCLVFLEFEFARFCETKSDEMMVRILKKTWSKMSTQAHEAAEQLTYNAKQQGLLEKAIKES